MQHQYTPEQVARFWAKVNKDGPIPAHRPELGPCWLWTASAGKPGYGHITVAGKTLDAHRLSYELAHGPLPPGCVVAHACDNRRCVHPAHLFLTTQAGNLADMRAKGRGESGECHFWNRRPEYILRGEKHPFRTHPEQVKRGEQCSWAKVSAADVQAIRERYATGTVTQKALGACYGISQGQIHRIVRGTRWSRAILTDETQ